MKSLVFMMVMMGAPMASWAQPKARIDLDDMMIKGELHNDDRLMILARQKNEMKNYIKFRTDFREEMLQELPVPRPRVRY